MTAFEHAPAELQERDQWVLWRWEERDGKSTKAPYRAREPFVRASSTDPRSWASFTLALSAVGYADGLGYVFSGDDPFCGVDLEVELPEADRTAITRRLNSYTEESVSGGWHVIVRASLNGGGRHPPGIGVFDRERFFVVTGLHLADTPLAVEPRQAELDAVIAEYLPTPAPVTQVTTAPRPVELDDRELLERMLASKAGDKIRRLWEGDWSDYPSQSEADFALLTHLAFWTRRDPERMQNLFEGSGLRREEGRDKPKSIGYLARTVEKAVAVTGDVWGSDLAPADGGTGSDSGFRSLVIAPAGIENQVVSGGSGGQSPPAVPPESPLPFQRLSVMVENAPAEPEWTWRGYLALFVLALLAGRPKVGKSTLLMALVAAAVRGELFLGLEARARGVLLLTEERRDTLAEKARILGLMDEEVPVYVLARGDVRDTPWPEVVRQAMTFCREHDLDVLIVDTLDRWTGLRGDAENTAGAVNEAMEPLQFAAAAGLAVVAVSHQRKSRGEYGEAVRGSNAFTGAVDVVIELERPSRTMQLGGHARVLRAVSRFTSTPEELFFELGDDGFLPITDVAEKKADAERAEVLSALEQHGAPVSVDDLFEEVDVGKRALRRRLAELRERDLAVRTGGGKKGDPYLWQAVDEREEP